MIAVAVLEDVGDPFVFHQTLDEVEVGLVVLDAIFPDGVAALQFERDLHAGVFVEDRLQDVGHALVLEDPQSRVRLANQSHGRMVAS